MAVGRGKSTRRQGMAVAMRACMYRTLCALLLVGLAGCSAPPSSSNEPIGTASQASTFANDQAAFDYFVGKGLTGLQAAGIVGNLDQESGVDPSAVQAGGPGRGIAQWSVGGRWDTDANDNCVWYAGQQGQSVDDLDLQLAFVWYELTNFSGYGLAPLQATTNVTNATVTFETDFEGCGQCDQSTRIMYAENVLSAYGSADYAAAFVSQSFPLATSTLTMAEGQVVHAPIELKNVGTATWNSMTRLGTTQPRDRTSVFADASWVAPNRPAAVSGTVPPGGTYTFAFDLAAPKTTGQFDEYFGVVQDGVAWFSDPGQGGPPDNQLEANITVVAPEGGAPEVSAPDGGADDAALAAGDAGADAEPVVLSQDGGTFTGEDASPPLATGGSERSPTAGTPTPAHASAHHSGGCSVGAPRGDAGTAWGAFSVLLVLGAVARFTARLAKSSALSPSFLFSHSRASQASATLSLSRIARKWRSGS
jgi:hypothetical protein